MNNATTHGTSVRVERKVGGVRRAEDGQKK